MSEQEYKNLNHTTNNPNGVLPKTPIAFKVSFKKMDSVITSHLNHKKNALISMNFYADTSTESVWLEHQIHLPIKSSTLLHNIIQIPFEQFMKFANNQISYNDIIQEQMSFIVKVTKRKNPPIYHKLNPEYYNFKYGRHVLLDFHEYNPAINPLFTNDFQPFIANIEQLLLSKTNISKPNRNTQKL